MPLVIDIECVWCRNCPANRVHTVRHLILDNNSQIALGLLANRFDQDLVSSKHTQSAAEIAVSYQGAFINWIEPDMARPERRSKWIVLSIWSGSEKLRPRYVSLVLRPQQLEF